MLAHTFMKYITLNSGSASGVRWLRPDLVVRVADLGYVNKHPTTSVGLHTDTGR